MENLLETLARELVEEPARVEVRAHEQEGTIELELRVAPGDRGRVIGQRGRTADALRALLGAVAERQGRRCTVEIL